VADVEVPGQARRGWFVTLEGPDGSGKSAQSERLRAAAAATGQEVVLVREPGGTAAGERIRAILNDAGPVGVRLARRTDALLFNAARAQLLDEVIRPALSRGALVISDRYADCGSELPLDELRPVVDFATGGLLPDRTILIDVPVEVGLGPAGSSWTAPRPRTTCSPRSGSVLLDMPGLGPRLAG
jgi:dTMP kinase